MAHVAIRRAWVEKRSRVYNKSFLNKNEKPNVFFCGRDWSLARFVEVENAWRNKTFQTLESVKDRFPPQNLRDLLVGSLNEVLGHDDWICFDSHGSRVMESGPTFRSLGELVSFRVALEPG